MKKSKAQLEDGQAICGLIGVLTNPANWATLADRLLLVLFENMTNFSILFDIVETLTRERAPTRWMKENEMLEMVKAELQSCELNDLV
jgi:hypothetical protein